MSWCIYTGHNAKFQRLVRPQKPSEPHKTNPKYEYLKKHTRWECFSFFFLFLTTRIYFYKTFGILFV